MLGSGRNQNTGITALGTGEPGNLGRTLHISPPIWDLAVVNELLQQDHLSSHLVSTLQPAKAALVFSYVPSLSLCLILGVLRYLSRPPDLSQRSTPEKYCTVPRRIAGGSQFVAQHPNNIGMYISICVEYNTHLFTPGDT